MYGLVAVRQEIAYSLCSYTRVKGAKLYNDIPGIFITFHHYKPRMFPMPFSKRSRFCNLQQGSGSWQPIIYLVSGLLKAHFRRPPVTRFQLLMTQEKNWRETQNVTVHTHFHSTKLTLSQRIALKGTEISPRAGTEHDSST